MKVPFSNPLQSSSVCSCLCTTTRKTLPVFGRFFYIRGNTKEKPVLFLTWTQMIPYCFELTSLTMLNDYSNFFFEYTGLKVRMNDTFDWGTFFPGDPEADSQGRTHPLLSYLHLGVEGSENFYEIFACSFRDFFFCLDCLSPVSETDLSRTCNWLIVSQLTVLKKHGGHENFPRNICHFSSVTVR